MQIGWGRVLQLEEEMTRSDAQGIADMEFRGGYLPKAVNLPAKFREKLVHTLNAEVRRIKAWPESQRF